MPLIEELKGSVVRRVDFLRIVFRKGTVDEHIIGFSSADREYSFADIPYEGSAMTTYLPATLGSVSGLRHGTDLQPQPADIIISPTQPDVLDRISVGHHYAEITYAIGFLDVDHNLLADTKIIRGLAFLSSAQITLSRSERVLMLTVENRLIEGRRRNGIIAENAHQQARYPGDTFARHIHTMAERSINWGGSDSTGTGGGGTPIPPNYQQR